MNRKLFAWLLVMALVSSVAAVPTMIPTTAPTINPAALDSPLCFFPLSYFIPECPDIYSSEGTTGPAGSGNTTITNYFNLSTGNFSSISNVTNYFTVYNSQMNQTPNMTAGPPGSQGPQGIQGIPGLDNMTAGPQGEQGIQGIPGLANMTAGPQGERGEDGTNGTNGEDGEKGDKGDKGDQGIPGLANMTAGPQGSQGPAGEIPDSSQFLFLNGTRAMTGNLNMGSQQITSVITGSTGDTATNKTYVDGKTAGMLQTLRTTSDQTINAGAGTFVDITDLTFPVTNGNSYAFHYYIAFTSLNATFGWKAGVNAPTGDLDFWAQSDVIANEVAGVATHTERHNNARDDMTLLTSTVTANVPLAIRIDGRYLCTQDGTFAPRFANELASNSNIKVLKGSYGWYF